MSTATDLAQRLRALHATRVHHFTPHSLSGQPQPAALAIVATDERWADLLLAAELLTAEKPAAVTPAAAEVATDQAAELIRADLVKALQTRPDLLVTGTGGSAESPEAMRLRTAHSLLIGLAAQAVRLRPFDGLMTAADVQLLDARLCTLGLELRRLADDLVQGVAR